jgi:hypothetical protein
MDESYRLALTCHPRIKTFLEGIVEENLTFRTYCDPALLHRYCDSAKKDVLRVESSWRSFADQKRLYESTRGSLFGIQLTKVPPGEDFGGPHVTYAMAGDSFHNWGLAVDLIFTRTGYGEAFYNQKVYAPSELASLYEDTGLVRYAKASQVRWAGRDVALQDIAHFECFQLPPAKFRKENLAVEGWWNDPEMVTSGLSVFAGLGWGAVAAGVVLGIFLFSKRRR